MRLSIQICSHKCFIFHQGMCNAKGQKRRAREKDREKQKLTEPSSGKYNFRCSVAAVSTILVGNSTT